MTMDSNMMAVALILIALLAVAAVLHWRRHQSHVLEKHFGPEYDRTVARFGGSRAKAERELMERRHRVEKLEIVPLSREDAVRYGEAWKALQARFVDDPKSSLAEADALVRDLMHKRGYPMGDFERRAADISVNYPNVVDHYRAGHDIALRDARGEADTEAQRQALIHYRALFGELLETESPRQARRDAREAREEARVVS
jgi:hypothetical protein